MPDLFESFSDVIAALGAASVPFAVCGGLAVSIHARPRATVDIDLLVPPEAIASLVEALAPLGFQRRERTPTRLAGGQIVMHRLTRIVPGDAEVLMLDVIEASAGVPGAAWEGRVTRNWTGQSVSVVSREGLVALKRLRGSPLDLADIAELEKE
ncbi:MAG TPA: nucleotidyl transferase AbiEii/AbiGii toxin family protein [Candidatus Limnocylindrales bacterium]|nr:nucleotidyl transferase AbiEii/AbiGii toxin family protein [Candidatus Limnocylindrales bacterium]